MNERLLHTPDGVRDIYNEECARKLKLQEDLRRVLKSYGCRDIETPTFEYFDVFGSEVGTIPSRELYKFFDREGNTLVLRPDITPSVARAVAKYFHDPEEIIRLCYLGNTFINHSSYQGRLKETTHLGAELIGADDPQSDAEVIAMVVDCLKASGLEEFQISIGQIAYFRSIVGEMEIPEEIENELVDFISNRNLFGVETLLSQLPLKEESRRALLELPSLYGSVEILDRAGQYACSEGAKNAVERLREMYRILTCYGVTPYVSFDLSMLSRYHYYTGLFFRGYTYGAGDAVVKGGRYNRLLSHFGKDAPSIGFVTVVDSLLSALSRQKISLPADEAPIRILYEEGQERQAIALAQAMRAKGRAAVLQKGTLSREQQEEFSELCRTYCADGREDIL